MTDSNNSDTLESGKKARILVVDDSRLVRVTATKFLSAKFDLILAEDGEEAWDKICADDTIQVVFTDLGMPKLDGYGLIQRVRQSENEGIRNQPIIVITGASEDEDIRRKVFEVGATDFITKPFKSTEMVARAEAHSSYRRDKENLEKRVNIDLLTGTLNTGGLKEQLERDISFVNRHSENLAVIIFELDDFTAIQQRISKQDANRIIKQAAAILLGAVRKEDTVGRFGLAKFVIILPMAKTEGVILLAKRLCARIESFKMTLREEAFPISMSAGISAARKGNHATAKDLLESAEQALVNARKVGRGEVQIIKIEDAKEDETTLVVSIDQLLTAINQGQTKVADMEMEAVLNQLAPLVALMSAEQKQRLIG